MITFIEQVLQDLRRTGKDLNTFTYILPSKRAGAFLLQKLGEVAEKPKFAPRVLSIEEFAEEVAALKAVDVVTALFEFYTAYSKNTPPEKLENFDIFATWAQTLLYDFNEIDRYLIDTKPFFGYLGDIQELNHWYLQEERTPLMENYLLFWNKLPLYYKVLKQRLEERGLAYQGMIYRQAAENIAEYTKNTKEIFVFIGFNALNAAEQEIFQRLLAAEKAEVYWDIDKAYFENQNQDVSLFIKQYLKKWPFYEQHEPKLVSESFQLPKEIKVLGVPKNIGQAKYVGEILSQFSADELKETAVVLGDESLLLPVLNSLPPNVQEVNITMGYALKNAPVVGFFEQLLQIHTTPGQDALYYRDVLAILSHPLMQNISHGHSRKLLNKIKKENLVYLKPQAIKKEVPEYLERIFELCFDSWKDNPKQALLNMQELVFIFRDKIDRRDEKLTLEFLYQLHLLFNKLSNLLQDYPYINNLKALLVLFKDVLAAKTVDFRGKPFTGLQLMGMLESRVLDFKNVILTSVNEGVLPAGKSSNSFIPYDLKCAYKLPTFKEKDAVYTYHFYHLLQRAKNVHLLYNTESAGLNAGEKSRFLLQLELQNNAQHRLEHRTVTPVVPALSSPMRQIDKTPEMLEILQARAAEGFSPSALTTYIRNPLDFYKQYIVGLKEQEVVEETVAYNTLGNVVHDTLEYFYAQTLHQNLGEAQLSKALTAASQQVTNQFKEHYTRAPLHKGKNLLIFEVAHRYVTNFLKQEIDSLKNGNSIKVLSVEEKLKCELELPELKFPVFLKGTVDRVDEYNGKLRIIDYKTGKVEQNQVEIVDWEEITSDYDKYSKPFQILCYAYMMQKTRGLPSEVEAGIISFKNLNTGFLKFCKKDKTGRGAKKDTNISTETLQEFEKELKKLILEICDPKMPFLEKEIKQNSWL